MNTTADFHHNCFYHIYNRTNNKESLFKSQENYSYFLRRYKHYLSPYLDIHAYALLTNHFHFSIRIKSEKEITTHIENAPTSRRSETESRYLNNNAKENLINELIVHQHQRFFISYAQAFNKMYNRKGNLFARQFKRSQFDPEEKFKYLQYYIHHNARKHRFVKHFLDDQNHSYKSIFTLNDSFLDVSYVLQEFISLERFIAFHEQVYSMKEFYGLEIEEDGF